MLVIFESTVVSQRIKTLKEFRTMSIKPFPINVFRNEKWTEISTEQLLPGDICSLVISGEENAVPCDMIVLSGQCVVNEAMLSGESTPLLKESLEEVNAEDIIDVLGEDKRHAVFGGTKILQSKIGEESPIKTPDSGCLMYVYRTGFNTSQGKLIRTMVYSTERITANNLESLLFILFLLIFAIAASCYVWVKGLEEEKNKYKLLLDCVLIITAVVPPELPMELSMAVNASLQALSKFAIYCTEPFRIPFAGKIDICCFDKTGTLTDEDLILQGVTQGKSLVPAIHSDFQTLRVLACCHSLMHLENEVVGDPMEKAAVESVNGKLKGSDKVDCNGESISIVKRFAFSSSLKRMSTIATAKNKQFMTIKGAPETIRGLLRTVPIDYDVTFQNYAKKGARVLALGYKDMPKLLSHDQLKSIDREESENNFTFCGFLVFQCPIKKDSLPAIKSLQASNHKVTMITGDNPLTAIHVAKELSISSKPVMNIEYIDGKVHALSDDETVEYKMDKLSDLPLTALNNYDLCLTGEAIDHVVEECPIILAHVIVYARASPSQKESVLLKLKDQGYITLMCGDGTNDVGALKQSHIGVALLDGKPEELAQIMKRMQVEQMKQRRLEMKKTRESLALKLGTAVDARTAEAEEAAISKLDKLMEDEELPSVKLGDASVAAPFTSKIATIEAVCNIIRQGRCTLVTTMQMYKILALNSLISAYSLSVLHLDGIRYGDFQVTVTGMLLASCFLFLTRAAPIQELAAKRPQPNIFNFYILLSILGQFAVHIASLVYIVTISKRFMFMRKLEDIRFEPNLLNSTIFLISLTMQVSTFVVNYQGRPFRESLLENKPLRNALGIVLLIAYVCASEQFPEFNEYLELVPFPSSVKIQLLLVMTGDLVLCFAIENVLSFFLSDSKPKKELYSKIKF